MKMRRISNFSLPLILAAAALVVYLWSALALYFGINEPEVVWENISALDVLGSSRSTDFHIVPTDFL
jgi:hypothetical protein